MLSWSSTRAGEKDNLKIAIMLSFSRYELKRSISVFFKRNGEAELKGKLLHSQTNFSAALKGWCEQRALPGEISERSYAEGGRAPV